MPIINRETKSFFYTFIFFKYTLLNFGSIFVYDFTASISSTWFIAFHFNYWVSFLDKYRNKKLETTFYSLVILSLSLTTNFVNDWGLRVFNDYLFKTTDLLWRRLLGLGIDGKNVFELLKISDNLSLLLIIIYIK